MSTTAPVPVTFWFDPACPFAWITSRWLLEVAAQRPLEVTWRTMSLAVINEGPDTPDSYREGFPRLWQGIRVAVAVEQRFDTETLGRFYTALGNRLHNAGRTLDLPLLAEALAECGLSADLVAAADDPSWDGAVRDSTQAVQDAVGTLVGTPVVTLDGRSFFGPVLNPIPRGEEALRVFDALRILYSVPAFSELKSARIATLDFS